MIICCVFQEELLSPVIVVNDQSKQPKVFVLKKNDKKTRFAEVSRNDDVLSNAGVVVYSLWTVQSERFIFRINIYIHKNHYTAHRTMTNPSVNVRVTTNTKKTDIATRVPSRPKIRASPPKS